MQASASDTAEERTLTMLSCRIEPSVKRRLMRMVRLSDAGTVQAWVYQAVMRSLMEQEERLSPILDVLQTQHVDWMNSRLPDEGD